MTRASVANSANGKIVTMISTFACTTGVAFTIPASAHPVMTPRISYVSSHAVNRALLPSMHPAWSELQGDLSRWEALPADWDGDDGIAPPEGSIKAAASILGKLRSAHILPPEASVSGDGEVAYNWSAGKNFASIALLADGHLVAYSRVAGHPVVEIDEPFNEALDLMRLFESLRDLV